MILPNFANMLYIFVKAKFITKHYFVILTTHIEEEIQSLLKQ